MTFPVENLLVLFSYRGYDRRDVNRIIDAYSVISTRINEGNKNKIQNAEQLKDFISLHLTPMGFSAGESITILEQLGMIFRSNLYELEPIPDGDPTGPEGGQRSMPGEESTLNIQGKFMMSNEDGINRHYEKNDVVYYEGKTYIATDDVMGWVPESMHPDNKWAPIDLVDNTIDGEEF